MTRVEYSIQYKGKEVKRVRGMEEAQDIIAQLGKGWKSQVVYVDFDPEDTPEKREASRVHARKVREAILRKCAQGVRAS